MKNFIKRLSDGGLAEDVYAAMERILDEDTNKEKMVPLDDVCKFLDEHLYTGTSTGDYDYGQEYIYSDFDNVSDLIFALRKAMKK